MAGTALSIKLWSAREILPFDLCHLHFDFRKGRSKFKAQKANRKEKDKG
jgi:hypothetical protein